MARELSIWSNYCRFEEASLGYTTWCHHNRSNYWPLSIATGARRDYGLCLVLISWEGEYEGLANSVVFDSKGCKNHLFCGNVENMIINKQAIFTRIDSCFFL